MKAKRNLFVSLVTLMLLLCCSVLFAGCDETSTDGIHAVAFKVDGRNYDIALVEEGKTVTLPADPEKDGYTFDGWFTDEACTQCFSASAVSQSIDVYAKFTANVYTITYEADGGTHANATSFTVEDKIVLANAEKNGYAFEGWYLNGERVSSVPKGTMENVTLTAKYIANGYSVTYQNTYNAANTNPKAYSADGADITLAPLTDLKAFTFLGWYEESGDTPVTTISAETGKNVTLVAKWEENTAHKSFLYNVSEDGDITITGVKDTTVTELVVPDYVYSIDFGAFQDCTSLQKLTVPYVGNRSNGEYGSIGYFFGAKSYLNNADVVPATLTDVTVTGGYNNNETMKTGAFYNCQSLKNVVIEDGVTYMESGIFYDNFVLESLTIPFVGDRKTDAFESNGYGFAWLFGLSTNYSDRLSAADLYYFNLTDERSERGMFSISYDRQKSRYVPNSLREITINGGVIPNGCLYAEDCNAYKNLEKVVIGEGVTYVSQAAFAGCSSLEEIVIPDTVYAIEMEAFEETAWWNNQPDGCVYAGNVLVGYKGNTPEDGKIVVKEGTIAIADRVFYNCDWLVAIEFPESLQYIGAPKASVMPYPCFSKCTNLTTITFSGENNLKYIGFADFQSCTSLDDISFVGDAFVEGSCFYDTKWYNSQADGPIYMGTTLFDYKGTAPSDTTLVIRDGITAISKNALMNQTGLTAITIPDTVKYIGARAFESCTNLIITDLPANLEYIGYDAFKATAKISVTIPSGLKSLSRGTLGYKGAEISFEADSQLEELFYESLNGTFENPVILPNSLKYIAERAFTNFSGTVILQNIDIEFTKQIKLNDNCKLFVCCSEEYANHINSLFAGGAIYYYSETEPVPNADGTMGNYWHYVDGVPTVWTIY